MTPVPHCPRRWKRLVLRALAATALSILALQSACARSEDSPWAPEPRSVTEWRKTTPHRQVASAEYSRAASLAPRPRIEIWSATGELLLLRSIPSYASQVEMLDEELLAARWFTKPLGTPAASGEGR